MIDQIVQITRAHTARPGTLSRGLEARLSRLYDSLADLLEYPGPDWATLLSACEKKLAEDRPELSIAFSDFRRNALDLSAAERQELYTRTFDLNPVCALDIGYHLFGENYKRGLFLARLRQTEAPYELGQDRQLPDYLPVLLRLIGKLEDEELRDALIVECLLPALDKMIAAFDQGENPYRELIRAVRISLALGAAAT